MPGDPLNPYHITKGPIFDLLSGVNRRYEAKLSEFLTGYGLGGENIAN